MTGIAKARRIAERAHRGWITGDGELFPAYLERIARTVAELGGGSAAQQAAWLHAVPDAGVSPADLARQGVSAHVVLAVEALRPVPHDPHRTMDRALGVTAAALVHYVVLADSYRGGQADHDRAATRLAERLGLPWPPPHAAVQEVVDTWTPEVGGHWGRAARDLERQGDDRALSVVLAGYREVVGDATRHCCLSPLRSAIVRIATKPGNAGSPPVLELIEQWWDSTEQWEAYAAVSALVASDDPTSRERLLRKASTDNSGLAGEAVRGLRGEGDPHEIAVLRSIVTRPGALWRWARAGAAARLTTIGGPDADSALRERSFGPDDPPWTFDRTWLRLHGAAATPWLTASLADRRWAAQATFALGELRAREAVNPLCALAGTTKFPVPQVEALGKIGSVDAEPALVTLLGHPHPDVRDHVLRALARIAGPAVVDAAVAACDDTHPLVRDRAARVLVRHGDHRAVPQLIRLCDGPHAAAAADALARIGDARAAPTLWHLFRTTSDKATCHAAGRGLARIDGLPEWPDRTDSLHRRAYTWLLGHKPDWGAEHRLEAAARDPDPLVRVQAAKAYARLGDRDHVQGLLTDPDPRVSAAATHSLSRLGELA